MIITVWLWQSNQILKIPFVLAEVLLFYLGLIAIIDLEHRVILHQTSFIGAILGIISGTWLHGWQSTLIGGMIGFSIALLLYFLGNVFIKIIAVIKGEKIEEEALGFGDVNLSGILGLLVGFPNIIFSLIISILVGGLVSAIFIVVALLRRQFRSFTAIPYGPFLIIGSITILFFSDYLLSRVF